MRRRMGPALCRASAPGASRIAVAHLLLACAVFVLVCVSFTVGIPSVVFGAGGEILAATRAESSLLALF